MRTIFSEEHEQFREQVRRFCEKVAAPHILQWERDGITPKSFWRMAGESGILCTTIPEQYGGPGGDFLHACIVTEELARIGLSTGIPVHSDMVSPYLLHYGSEELKQRFLPRLCQGEIIGSIGMTEPGTGSDLKNIKTTAVRDKDEWVINGQKTWITNGINCGVVLLACKTDPAAGAKGVSLIAVEADRPGFTKSARPLEKIGLHAQDTAELFFDNVRVPASNLLGELNKGFIYLMQQLPQERLVIALRSTMILETQLEATLRYTAERKVFGNSILSFQNSKFKLAEVKAYCGMLRVYIDDLVRQHVQKPIDVEQAASAKLVATELLNRYLDDLLQLHGGYGYSAEYGIGRAWVDARVSRIAGGTSEVLKDIISRRFGSSPA
jgi:acyl-CoA dehydrogenase